MRYRIWQGMAGVVVAIGLDMTGLEFGWKFIGILAFIISGTTICEMQAERRP